MPNNYICTTAIIPSLSLPGGTTTIGATPNNSSGGKNVGQTTMTLVDVSMDTVYAGRDFDIDLWPPDRQGHLTLKTSDGVIYDNDVTGPTVTFIGPYNVSSITSIWTIADGRATDAAPVLQPANYWDLGISGPEYVAVGTTNSYTAVVTVTGDGLPDPMDGTYNWSITGSTMTFADGIHTGETISVIASTNNAGESTLSVTFTPNEQGLGPKSTNKTVTAMNVVMKRPQNFLSGTVPVPYYFLWTFNDQTPAICSVNCIVKTEPDNTDIQSFLTGKITWTIDSVNGSTLSWNSNSPYNGNVAVYGSGNNEWGAWADYSGMPEHNSSFGRKTATYNISDVGCTGSGIAKIFFPRDARNHPGTGSGTTPNWYYYWIDGGVVSGLGDFEYTNDNTICGMYDKSSDTLYVGNGAPKHNISYFVTHQYWIVDETVDPPVYCGFPTNKWKGKASARPSFTIGADVSGIDCCAATLAHERKHKSNHEQCSTSGDEDDDGCPDSYEGKAPYYLCNGRPDTYGLENVIDSRYATYGDNEFLCRIEESNPVPVVATNDWSDGEYGKNYKYNTP